MSDFSSYLTISNLIILSIVIVAIIAIFAKIGALNGHSHNHRDHQHQHPHQHPHHLHVPNDIFEESDMQENLEGEWREVQRYAQDVVDILTTHGYIKHTSTILDLGAGTGIYTQLFINTVDATCGGQVYAADPSAQMRSILHTKFQSLNHVHIITPTQTSIPITSHSIDLIYLCDVYHHLSNPTTLVHELYRILRSHGTLVIVDSSPEHMPIMKQEIEIQYPEVYKQLRANINKGHGHHHSHGHAHDDGHSHSHSHGHDSDSNTSDAEAAALYRPSMAQVISQVCHVGFHTPHDLTSSIPFTHHYILTFTKSE